MSLALWSRGSVVSKPAQRFKAVRWRGGTNRTPGLEWGPWHTKECILHTTCDRLIPRSEYQTGTVTEDQICGSCRRGEK